MQKNQNEESHISNYIKRFPFNGRSKYLIDKFYIIGYNLPTLHKVLFEDNEKDNLSKHIIIDKMDEEKLRFSINLQQFHLKEEPVILNEISSDFGKECLSYDMMKEMILPNKSALYYTEEDLSTYNKEKEKEKTKEKNINNKNNLEDFFGYERTDNFDIEQLKTSCVIFTSNPQAENNSKKSINGFAYIFYKKLKKKKILAKKVISFYIPFIFTLVSEYPFFNGFYKLCHQIKSLFYLQKNDIPIEIMLYNLIKNAESPINGDIVLSLKPFFLQLNRKESNKFNTIIEDINEEEKSLDDNDINKKKKFAENSVIRKSSFVTNKSFFKKTIDIIQNKSPEKKKNSDDEKVMKMKSDTNLILKFINLRKSKSEALINEDDEIDLDELFPKIKFEILPGYPLIQYNLAKVLLHIMSPIHVIKIFFYTFLEKNVIFFSKNLQYLSISIHSYLNLNFPLNDEKYYFINASVSLDNYINNNSPFVGATFTTLIGINSAYNQKYQKSPNKIKEHLVVNLDKDEIIEVEDKDDKENSKKNKVLFNYIKKICKKEVKNEQKQTILAKEIYILYKKLTEIYNLLHNTNENEMENTESFKLFKDGDYMDYDDNPNDYIKKTNLEIQDAFYRLINNLCLYFYQNLSIKTDYDDKKNYSGKTKKQIDETGMNVIFRNDYEDEYIKEEKYFLDELRETMKYESFVYGFVQSYSPIDLYKIPLTFTEEFLSIISRKNSILENNINFFEIIDQLYDKKRMSCIEIDFKPFFMMYYKEFKNCIDREIDEMNEENVFNEELIKMNYFKYNNTKNKYLYYRDYELDNNLLMKYLNLIDTLDEQEYNNIFYMSQYLNQNEPENILVIKIEDIIEDYSIKTHLLSKSDLCCCNIILLFSLSLNFLDDSIDCQSFLGTLFQTFTVFRKYYAYIINMTFILFSNCIKNNNYSRAHFYLILYFICVNSIRSLKLVPNEGLMNIMKKFNDIDLNNFDEKYQKDSNNINSKSTPDINNVINDEEKNVFKKEKLTKEKLFPIYNFEKNHFYKEKEIIDLLKNDSTLDSKGKIIQPKIRYLNNILKIETNFYSPLMILNKLIGVYNKYITDLNEEHIYYNILIDCCMNILVYMRNLNEFSDLGDIKDVVEIIFFLFLNKTVKNYEKK